jgi:PEP-CTERM/exosortase A-associated glycosyltransferase
LNGVAAIRAGVPLVYEMRSSWEDAAVSEGLTTEGSIRYRASRALESFVTRSAQHVFVICEGLRDELIFRGVNSAKISVVPNALQDEMFDDAPSIEVRAVIERHGLANRSVIGYFGSFFDWEGIDVLVDSLPGVIAAVPDVMLLLAGGGRAEKRIRERIRLKELEDRVVFAGRIESSQIRAYYQVADTMVYPRISLKLTEMVTPLKPLEAMASGIPVVASDIGGHRELIEDGISGYLCSPGNREALAASIIRALTGENAAIVAAARRRVKMERRWPVVAKKYCEIYSQFGVRPGLTG